MPSRRTASLLAAAAAIAFAPTDGRAGEVFATLPTTTADLAAYRWKKRPVLIFAPSANHPAYLSQRAALEAASDGLVERDIVVLSDTDPQASNALRRAFDAEGFEVLLLGKDGGVKLRAPQPISTDVLFAKIDAMPMRRREMSE